MAGTIQRGVFANEELRTIFFRDHLFAMHINSMAFMAGNSPKMTYLIICTCTIQEVLDGRWNQNFRTVGIPCDERVYPVQM